MNTYHFGLWMLLADGNISQSTIVAVSVSIVAVILVAGFGLYMWLRQQDQIERYIEINRLTNKIGVGIINFAIDSGFVSYASDSFFEILGISRKTLSDEYHSDFFRLIDIPDGVPVRNAITDKGDLVYEFAYPPVKAPLKDFDYDDPHRHRTRWFKLSGSRIMRRGHVTLSAIVEDITTQKEMIEKQMIEHKKLVLVTELSKEVIWSYDVILDTLTLSECFMSLYGGKTEIRGFIIDSIWKEGFICKDDYDNFEEFIAKIRHGNSKAEVQFRLRNKQHRFRWCKIEAHPVKIGEGFKKEFIGTLIDIDDEKRNIQQLETKAMRDLMTGAYNKEYTKVMINKFISEHPDSSGMLLLVDIDKFKNINDTYGHRAGDEVIIEVVREATGAFRANDIVGRVGGDEFVVFICDVPDHDVMIRQAKKLHDVLGKSVEFEGMTINKSASIGIALYPQHGDNYNKLVECADKALYKVKGSGRDSFIVYDGKE